MHYYGSLFGTRYSRIDQVKFFKGCLPQMLLGPFLDILFHLLHNSENYIYLLGPQQMSLNLA